MWVFFFFLRERLAEQNQKEERELEMESRWIIANVSVKKIESGR